MLHYTPLDFPGYHLPLDVSVWLGTEVCLAADGGSSCELKVFSKLDDDASVKPFNCTA